MAKDGEVGDDYETFYNQFYEGTYQIPEDCPNHELVVRYMKLVAEVINDYPMLNYAESANYSWDYPDHKELDNYKDIYNPHFHIWDPIVNSVPPAMLRGDIVALVQHLESGEGNPDDIELYNNPVDLQMKIDTLSRFLHRDLYVLIVRGDEDINVKTDLLTEEQLNQVRKYTRLRNQFIAKSTPNNISLTYWARESTPDTSGLYGYARYSAKGFNRSELFNSIITGETSPYFESLPITDTDYWKSLPEMIRILEEYLKHIYLY